MIINRLIKLQKIPLLKRFFSRVLYIVAGVVIPREVKIGKNVSFAHNALGSVIYFNTVIKDNATIFQNVTIGRADVYIDGPDNNTEEIIIEDGAIVCAGAKVLCKRKETLVVGKNSIVAANAVLLNSTGENEIWGGVPAKLIGYRKKQI